MRTKLHVLGSFFCLLLTVATGVLIFTPRVHMAREGESVEFSENHRNIIIVDGDGATIEAAAAEFFAIRLNDLVMFGIPGEVPVGWNYGDYLKLETATIGKGAWRVEDGNSINVRITASAPVTVAIKLNEVESREDTVLMVIFMIAILLIWNVAIVATR